MIIPGFNVGSFAAEALDSLRAQTRTDWTALLVDDASTDATAEIFAEAAATDSRFRLFRHERQKGLGAARNVALDEVETPFLAYLDSDDVLSPTALERMVGTLDASGSDFVAGAYVRLRPETDGSYSSGTVQPWVAAATDPERQGTSLIEHPDATANIVAWSKVSRTDFWNRNGLRFPEGRLYEDQVVAQQMLVHARKFDVIPDVVVHWRIRPDNSSITQREADLAVLRDCLDAMTDGLSILSGTGHTQAAEARRGQLLRMDIPRLAGVAATHSDPEYRRAVGAFTQLVWDQATSARSTTSDESARLIDAALLW